MTLVEAIICSDILGVREMLEGRAPTLPLTDIPFPEDSKVAVPGMSARDIAWETYACQLSSAANQLAHELGAEGSVSESLAQIGSTALGWASLLALAQRLDTEKLLDDPELAKLIFSSLDRERLGQAAALVQELGEPMRTPLTAEVLVGTWKEFALNGRLLDATAIEDGFCWTLVFDEDGTYELTMDHDPYVFCQSGRWSLTPCFTMHGETRGWQYNEDGEEERVPHRFSPWARWLTTVPAITLDLGLPRTHDYEGPGRVAFARDERVNALRSLVPSPTPR